MIIVAENASLDFYGQASYFWPRCDMYVVMLRGIR